MLRASSVHRLLVIAGTTIVLALMAAPGAAQSTGMIKGKVVDGQGQPIEGATIVIEFKEGVNRRYEIKTNKKGEFIQIGLATGGWTVTADKVKVGSQSFDVRVRLGQTAEVKFQLAPGVGGTTLSKEDTAKNEAAKKQFEDGVAASRGGKYDEAIAKFTEALTLAPKCADCYYNIGFAQAQKKQYKEAEDAYKKAIELNVNYVVAYNGLANVYNAQRRFDEATAAGAEAANRSSAGAAGGGNVDAVFNQGVIFWNAGKIPEAKKQFEEAVKINSDHADSHYWLGMATLNEGKMPEAVTEFETYIKLAPDGEYAAQAKGILAQIKKN